MIKITQGNVYAVKNDIGYEYYLPITKQILFGGQLAIKFNCISNTIFQQEEVLQSGYCKNNIKIYDFYIANKEERLIKIGKIQASFTHAIKYFVYHNTKINGYLNTSGAVTESAPPLFPYENYFYVFLKDNLTESIDIAATKREIIFPEDSYIEGVFASNIL